MTASPPPRPRLVSSTAASEALGVHPGTLWRWHNDPTHPVTADSVTPGGHLRWDLDRLRTVAGQMTGQDAARPEDTMAQHDDREWRVGRHYGVHVYAVNPDGGEDEPVASFLGPPELAEQRAEQMVREHEAGRTGRS